MDKKIIIAAVAAVVVIAIAAFALSSADRMGMRASELQPISSKLPVQD